MKTYTIYFSFEEKGKTYKRYTIVENCTSESEAIKKGIEGAKKVFQNVKFLNCSISQGFYI